MPKSPYSIGYKKPPRKSQFRPGHSGNPKGRPRDVRNLASDLGDELSQKILITEGNKQQVVTKQRAMLKALVAKSLKGDTRAASTLLNLIPAVEQAQQGSLSAEELSRSDQEILTAFRRQLVDEVANGRRRKQS